MTEQGEEQEESPGSSVDTAMIRVKSYFGHIFLYVLQMNEGASWQSTKSICQRCDTEDFITSGLKVDVWKPQNINIK